MEHDPPHFTAKCLRAVPVESYDRTAEDRDLVRQHPAVGATSSGERHTLIETKQRLACRWLVFDNDFHIRHPRTQIRRQRVECVLCVLLKFRKRIVMTRLHEKRVDPAWSPPERPSHRITRRAGRSEPGSPQEGRALWNRCSRRAVSLACDFRARSFQGDRDGLLRTENTKYRREFALRPDAKPVIRSSAPRSPARIGAGAMPTRLRPGWPAKTLYE